MSATDDTLNEIAMAIRQQRERLGMTQQDLADFLGITRAYVIMLESGNGTTQLRRLIDTLSALGMDLTAVRR